MRTGGVRERARAKRGPERAKIAPSRLDSRSDGPFRPTKSTQDRSKRHFRSTWSTEVAQKELRRAILVDLRSILGALGVDFAGFSLAFRSSGPIRSKNRRLTNNIGKPQKNIGKTHFAYVRVCAHDAKLDRKSLRTRFSTELSYR